MYFTIKQIIFLHIPYFINHLIKKIRLLGFGRVLAPIKNIYIIFLTQGVGVWWSTLELMCARPFFQIC